MLDTINTGIEYIVEFGSDLMEAFGILILLYYGIKCFIEWITKDRNHNIRIELGNGISTALEFKMGAEALETVVVHDWQTLGILAAIVAVRASMAFLLHWEVSNEKKEEVEEKKNA